MLTTEPIRELMNRQPFLPFKIHMRGGKVHEVRHPDYIAVSPTGKSAVILNADGMEILNVRLIAELVVPGLIEGEQATKEGSV